MIDCNNDKVFNIPYCNDCKVVLIDPKEDYHLHHTFFLKKITKYF